ncbi:unnamed protein product [Allacma fusca]|uniref:Uncharacterized protein n=1 Tax=Allacma fusca TaxID=39272 RepID=A0A8J2LRM3_9HEXA|nr:unnamed protein product [Allacma fusca]
MLREELCIVIVGVIAIVTPVVPSILGGGGKDVQDELDLITNKLSGFERPNQIMIDSFVQQIQQHCPNRTINETIYNEISTCMEKNFNNTALEEDIREAIPAGKLDEVFHNVCKKWPVAKKCLKHVVDVIDDCWSKGDKVNTVMDSMVNFFCGDKNDGEKIALFFADGGMRCMDSHGEEVKECIMNSEKIKNRPEINDINDIPNEEDICKSLKQLHDCSHQGLSKCDDSTPENLVTSMLKAVSKAVGCSTIPEPPSRQTSAAEYMTTSHFLLLPCILVVGVFKLL